MKRKVLKAIYEQLDHDDRDKNPFEPEEYNNQYDDFVDKYIYTTPIPTEQQHEERDDLGTLLLLERETAFEVGFLAAMQLLKECGFDTDKLTAQE